MKTLGDFFFSAWWIGGLAIYFLQRLSGLTTFDFLIMFGGWSLILLALSGVTSIIREWLLR